MEQFIGVGFSVAVEDCLGRPLGLEAVSKGYDAPSGT